ncbi:unnamed protein product [Rotaria sp. Silwood1]|nr:unnamed protein product [Rotaria sp. Silwood1]CAF5034450.1 unnamed protein product [Rotaria sp. Silwood1]
MACADKRVQAINELVNSCQIIKMYNWEKPMEERVHNLRLNELGSVLRASHLYGINMGLYFSSLSFISLATFGDYWLMSDYLKPVHNYSALTFFGFIRVSVTNYLLIAIKRFAEMLTASKRIDAFMRLTKIQERITPTTQIGTIAISMNNASFSWIELICKSSLLSAILGEMPLVSGDIRVFGSFTYAAQTPWIFADIIRVYILLGKPFD